MAEEMVPKAVVDVLVEQIAALQATVERLTAVIEEKNQIIQNQNRARFGQSSEKRAYVLPKGQISLFDIAGDGNTKKEPAEEASPEKKEVRVAAHTRKAKRTMEELCADLEEEYVDTDLPEESKVTEDGRKLKYIGTDIVRTELVREPARIYKRVYRCKVYADPKSEKDTGYAKIYRPHVPEPLIPHSYASASVVTNVMVRKYADGLPLYRQEQMWARLGVALKRATMGNWVIQTSDMYLKPFSEAFLEELLKQNVIHADETSLQVNREPGRAPTAESRIWAYASGKRAARQVRYFRYEPSRKGACAQEVLKEFHGVLLADGYSGYNLVEGVTRAGCWAHMRRKWLEAMPKNATLENSRAAKGLDFCSRLFAVEQELNDLPDKERREQRQILSKPIVDEYYKWIETIFKPAGKLKDAVTYAINQEEYLRAFLDHGEIEISNNQVENAIRPIVVGRKNWLFCDTPAGACASAIVYTVIETAKANGLDPEGYLNHLLSVLPDHFFRKSLGIQFSMDSLMPWSEKMQKLFAKK